MDKGCVNILQVHQKDNGKLARHALGPRRVSVVVKIELNRIVSHMHAKIWEIDTHDTL